jgi:multidrug transporter EmrE-like cation transporter
MKHKPDYLDTLIKSVNWKVWNFNTLPVLFGTILATLDILMMGWAKMVNEGTLSSGIGIPSILGLYALTPLVFLRAMRYESMVVTNLIWDLVSDVLVTLSGIFIFKETFGGIKRIGIILSFVSIGLMTYDK